MNAVISLCHFCENHGPSVLFSTQTFQAGDDRPTSAKFYGPDGKLRELLEAKSRNQSRVVCEACQSVSGFLTNDHEKRVSFISSERPLEDNVARLVDQAAVRSLSCEVVPGKEGEMYFGDERRGHVLSHTFFLQDSQARGFHRWFSVVIFMRDKHYLINSWQFLQTHLAQLVSQLQARAHKVYGEEQKRCSTRSVRLTDSAVGRVARPITILTDSPQLFAQVHQWFTWLLSVGGQRLVEHPHSPSLSLQGHLVQHSEDGFVVVERASSSNAVGDVMALPQHDAGTVFWLRELSEHLGGSRMVSLMYALLTGRQLVVRGPQRLVQFTIHLFRFLLPTHKFRAVEFSGEYLGPEHGNVIGLPLSAAVPVASSLVERLDIVPLPQPGLSDGGLELNQFQYLAKSGSALPSRQPSFLTELTAFLGDPQLTDHLAYTLISGLRDKWTHTANLMKKTKQYGHGQDVTALLLSLGAQEQDYRLLHFWAT